MDANAQTPAGVTITAHLADGSTVNVTEGVQVLYDYVIQSLDWGSGFFTVEDALPVAEIAALCGFKECEEPLRYLREAMHNKERDAYWRANPEAAKGMWHAPPIHECVFSSAGRCMWRCCGATSS